MIIQIDDTNQKVKKITIEFDDIENNSEVIIEKNENKDKKKSKKEINNIKEENPINFDEYSDSNINQEIVEKPEIPDLKRDPLVSNTMQNLSF